MSEWRVRCDDIYLLLFNQGCFKILIEKYGTCPVHLEATSVVGSLLSITGVTSEDLPGLWKQFELDSDDNVNVTLCVTCSLEARHFYKLYQ